MAFVKKHELSGITPELLSDLVELRNQKQGKSLQIITDHLLNGITVVEAAKKIGVTDTSTASATLKSLITIHNRALDYAADVAGKVDDELNGITQEQWDALIVLRNQRKGKSIDIVHKMVFENKTLSQAAQEMGAKDITTAFRTVKSVQQCHKRALTYAENYLHFKLVENALSIEGESPDLGVNDYTLQILLHIDRELKEYKEAFKPTSDDTLSASVSPARFNTLARLYLIEKITNENINEDWSVIVKQESANVRKGFNELFDYMTGNSEEELSSTAKYLLKDFVKLNESAAAYY